MIRILPIFLLLSVGMAVPARKLPAAEGDTATSDSVAAVVQEIDAQLARKWQSGGIGDVQPVDDAGFIRRAWLDLLGKVPPPDEVVKFLDDRSSDKRARLIDSLLSHERYPQRWSDYWETVLLGRVFESATIDRVAFHRWLEKKWETNAPWDQIVRELITAEGVNLSGNDYGKQDSKPANKDHNPAVNWFVRHSQNLPELSAATSRIFLGVQIQCAQCHDHKEEKWKQDDFRRFTAFYAKTWPMLDGRYMEAGKVSMIALDVKDRLISPPTGGKLEEFFGSYRDYAGITPRTLDGHNFNKWSSRRVALADWIISRDNPWFARAFVNRMWAELLGAGFVEPIDDFRPGNPAVCDDTLELLARDFRDHGYDMQRLIRIITLTKSYHAACVKPAKEQPRQGYWSHYPIKPLSIEVMFDTVLAATGSDAALDRLSHGRLDLIRGAFVQQFVMHLGTDETMESRDAAETIARALMQMNGVVFSGSVQTGNNQALDQILKSTSDESVRIEQLYLRTLSRRPDASEMAFWKKFLNDSREVVKSPGTQPKTPYKVKGLSALMTSPEIRNAGKDADFRELIREAKTGADFASMGKHITNLVEAGMYVRALREFAAEAPFQSLVENGGGSTPQAQAYEDLFWSLLNSTEFLNNH